MWNTNTDTATQLRKASEAYADLEARVSRLEAQLGPEATEAAEELADETGVDLKNVQGTGEDGRILVGDVRDYLDAQEEESEPESDGDEAEAD